MSQVAVAEHLLTERRPLGAAWDKLMMWLFLGSDAMGFAGLLGAYAALRFGDDHWPVPQVVLGINFTALMTFVLICSSVTMVKSFEAMQKDDRRASWRWLFMTFLGGVFFLEGASVVAQVASFKLTGKRIFLMAPIHHHYEKRGWPEPKIIVRFWIISILLALVSLASLKLR